MKYGFSFKGIHSNDMDVTVKSESRPIIPEVKKTEYSALLMDGSYDFSRANPYNREFYNERTFCVQMYITGVDLSELNRKLTKITQWLTGTGDLIFDDTPLVKWKARRNGEISYAPELRGKKAILSVEFSVSAFGYSVWSTCEDLTLNSDVLLGMDIPLDMSSKYAFSLEVPCYNAANGYPQKEFSFCNFGDRPVRPVITVKSDTGITKLKFVYGDNYCDASLGWDVTDAIFDFNTQQVKFHNKVTGEQNYHGSYEGVLEELPQGINTFFISCKYNDAVSTGNITVKVDFEAQTMWDFAFENVDWGDTDA